MLINRLIVYVVLDCTYFKRINQMHFLRNYNQTRVSRNKSLCLNCFCDLDIDPCPLSHVIMLGGVLNNGHLKSDLINFDLNIHYPQPCIIVLDEMDSKLYSWLSSSHFEFNQGQTKMSHKIIQTKNLYDQNQQSQQQLQLQQQPKKLICAASGHPVKIFIKITSGSL